MVAAPFRIFCAPGWQRAANTGARVGSTGALEKGTPLPVFIEVTEEIGTNEDIKWGVVVLRCEGDSTDRGGGGYGSVDVVVIGRLAEPSGIRNGWRGGEPRRSSRAGRGASGGWLQEDT